MGSIRNLPVGATCVEAFSGTIEKPDAWTHGKHVAMERWYFYGSKGYKSEYDYVRTEYLVLRIEGHRTQCNMYSGKRLEHAARIFAGWKSDLVPYMVNVNEGRPAFHNGKLYQAVTS